ncbi:hypothetical protein EG343_04750 [Chryseobacterium nakagawai]|uniref:Uncharacterized protein n=2 Tax=Chryseobacterium nakagawai TaxID=1241982 RepID=A0AAD0YK27_CHRNA|nr:hypothetical protein EG343_04750 [Chryseobacterium nakagawai]
MLLSKIFIMLFIINYAFLFGQKNQVRIKYSVIKDSYYPNQKDTITYYYILNTKNKIRIKKHMLSQFTFDQDSLAISGYISEVKSRILYFSYDKKDVQKIDLHRKNTNIKYWGKFGSDINLIPINNKTYSVIQNNIIPSHKLYVFKIIYLKGYLFPNKIIFREKGSQKDYISEGIPF